MVADDLKENIPIQKEAPVELNPWPDFIQRRIDMWDKLMAEVCDMFLLITFNATYFDGLRKSIF
ncbi:unnamed protein product [Strongylus vulgaris]|uniref:Uncharacterized protein n=1 Tax=Strongylus vulgaris TaxID=40348 RepID=A0A3P7J414_STRVU|nr:unnamed protein product [Strongylus vulgaris]